MLSLQAFKKLTEQIGQKILTEEIFSSLFSSDLTNDGEKSSLRYRLALTGVLPGEPKAIRSTSLENRLYTSDCSDKSDQVKHIGVIGDDLYGRLLVKSSKKLISNFYVSQCSGRCRELGSSLSIPSHIGTKPDGGLCIDWPHKATCLNLQDTDSNLKKQYTEVFLHSFFNMIKKYTEVPVR